MTVTVSTSSIGAIAAFPGSYVAMQGRGRDQGWDEGGYEEEYEFKKCFLHGTKVSRFSPELPNQCELVGIEDIQTGDLVWACDPLSPPRNTRSRNISRKTLKI